MESILEPIYLYLFLIYILNNRTLKDLNKPIDNLCNNLNKINEITKNINKWNNTMSPFLQSIGLIGSCYEYPEIIENQIENQIDNKINNNEINNENKIYKENENENENNLSITQPIIEDSEIIDNITPQKIDNKENKPKQTRKTKSKLTINNLKIKKMDRVPKKFQKEEHIEMIEKILKYISLSKNNGLYKYF